jgi:hypothetical protein
MLTFFRKLLYSLKRRNIMISVGSKRLRDWWETLPHGSRTRAAADIGVSIPYMHALFSGRSAPSIAIAASIEKETGGKVKVLDFIKYDG